MCPFLFFSPDFLVNFQEGCRKKDFWKPFWPGAKNPLAVQACFACLMLQHEIKLVFQLRESLHILWRGRLRKNRAGINSVLRLEGRCCLQTCTSLSKEEQLAGIAGLLAWFFNVVSSQVTLNAWTFCSGSGIQPLRSADAAAPLRSPEECFAGMRAERWNAGLHSLRGCKAGLSPLSRGCMKCQLGSFEWLGEWAQAGRRNNHKTTDETQKANLFSLPRQPDCPRSSTRAEARKWGRRHCWARSMREDCRPCCFRPSIRDSRRHSLPLCFDLLHSRAGISSVSNRVPLSLSQACVTQTQMFYLSSTQG